MESSLRIEQDGVLVAIPRAVEAQGGEASAAYARMVSGRVAGERARLAKMTRDDLAAMVTEMGVDVNGTGSEGRDRKADMIAAILAARAAEAVPAVEPAEAPVEPEAPDEPGGEG